MKANTLDVDRGVLASLAKKATVWGLIPLIQISFFVSHSQTIPKQVRMKPNKSDVVYTACFLGKKDTFECMIGAAFFFSHSQSIPHSVHMKPNKSNEM